MGRFGFLDGLGITFGVALLLAAVTPGDWAPFAIIAFLAAVVCVLVVAIGHLNIIDYLCFVGKQYVTRARQRDARRAAQLNQSWIRFLEKEGGPL